MLEIVVVVAFLWDGEVVVGARVGTGEGDRVGGREGRVVGRLVEGEVLRKLVGTSVVD